MGEKLVCQVTGKVLFTKKDAYTSVNNITHIKLRAYHCNFCNGWHVTHSRPHAHKGGKKKAKKYHGKNFEGQKQQLEVDSPQITSKNVDNIIHKERFRKFIDE